MLYFSVNIFGYVHILSPPFGVGRYFDFLQSFRVSVGRMSSTTIFGHGIAQLYQPRNRGEYLLRFI